ncbi:TPA_asm: hypothetical protein vir530_00032 [dsDNA virus vir530]|jgi:hypothetical protein|nr:TPA_asm: hypothetical protein vir530_00032 [dsDNA virus vir530]
MNDNELEMKGPDRFEPAPVLKRQIEIDDLEEVNALRTLASMMNQMVRAVVVSQRVDDDCLYVQFNATKFLDNLKRVETYVRREFMPPNLL